MGEMEFLMQTMGNETQPEESGWKLSFFRNITCSYDLDAADSALSCIRITLLMSGSAIYLFLLASVSVYRFLAYPLAYEHRKTFYLIRLLSVLFFVQCITCMYIWPKPEGERFAWFLVHLLHLLQLIVVFCIALEFKDTTDSIWHERSKWFYKVIKIAFVLSTISYAITLTTVMSTAQTVWRLCFDDVWFGVFGIDVIVCFLVLILCSRVHCRAHRFQQDAHCIVALSSCFLFSAVSDGVINLALSVVGRSEGCVGFFAHQPSLLRPDGLTNYSLVFLAATVLKFFVPWIAFLFVRYPVTYLYRDPTSTVGDGDDNDNDDVNDYLIQRR